jgi:hypothetical protein
MNGIVVAGIVDQVAMTRCIYNDSVYRIITLVVVEGTVVTRLIKDYP